MPHHYDSSVGVYIHCDVLEGYVTDAVVVRMWRHRALYTLTSPDQSECIVVGMDEIASQP